jgi:hypothetical protein
MALAVLLSGMLQTSASAPVARPAPQVPAPQIASYRMEVRLDPARKTVAGIGRITYRNPSTDTLNELWLHLYLRAFRDDTSVWMRESGGAHRGNAMDPSRRGDISVSSLKLADGTDLLAGATISDTLMRVLLPQPLGSGQAVELDVEWTSKLPRVFARTGYGGRDDTFFMVGQWYPKMAVYERGRWDTEPWHVNAEFFHDFGSYDVTITTPGEYVVAATGVGAEPSPVSAEVSRRFTADNVTDFAFAASPDFRIQTTRAGGVEVLLYYLPEHGRWVDEYLDAATGSLLAYGEWYGAYPHPRLTVVDVPENAGGAGGMEYPTLVTGGTYGAPPGSGATTLVVAHEVGHQWWPMQTATHEGREPWLDEGLTEYSGVRYMAEAQIWIGLGGRGLSALAFEQAQYATQPDQPSTLPAWAYSGGSYASGVYFKPALGLWTLEEVVGTERFRRAMADYLAKYRFKHPTGADFRATLEQSLNADLSWFFDDYLAGEGVIDYAAGKVDQQEGKVWVVREGTVPAPVEVVVTLADGERRTMSWDGQGALTSFQLEPGSQVTRVEIDPERKLKAELDILDNGVTLQAQIGPALTLGGRLAFWLQAVAEMLGTFG